MFCLYLQTFKPNQMKWISIDSDKPKANQIVWVMIKDMESPVLMSFDYINDGGEYLYVFSMVYSVPYYYKGVWCVDSEWDDNYEVTHWMPINFPEPISKKL